LALPVVTQQRLHGDVAAMAAACADSVRQGPRGVYLWGGECTVQLPADAGRGGRLQQLALALLQHDLADAVTVLAASSDGRDGNSDAAGVLLDATRWSRLLQHGEAAAQAYASANSYAFWARHGGHLFCSATETNVMDLLAIIKE
jgi:hydroxypyruvate reductase